MIKKRKSLKRSIQENTIPSTPKDLPPEVKEILKNVPDEEKPNVIKEYLCVERFQGIIPHPKHLEEYNKIIPDGADRILKMAEKQSEHRIDIENRVIKSQIFQSKLGQLMAFFIANFSLVITYFLAIKEHEWVAGILASSTIMGLVSAFIYGKKGQRKQLDQKNIN